MGLRDGCASGWLEKGGYVCSLQDTLYTYVRNTNILSNINRLCVSKQDPAPETPSPLIVGELLSLRRPGPPVASKPSISLSER